MTPSKSRIERIIKMLEKLKAARCVIPREMLKVGPDTLAVTYNGIGPEWMPDKLRQKLTKHLPTFEPAAMVHDWQYTYADDRSHDAFLASNALLEENCRRLAAVKYPWYKSPIMRPLAILAAKDMRYACDTWGYSAWLEAKK